MFLEECKYVERMTPECITEKIKKFSDFDREDSAEENFDEENWVQNISNEKNYCIWSISNDS